MKEFNTMICYEDWSQKNLENAAKVRLVMAGTAREVFARIRYLVSLERNRIGAPAPDVERVEVN